MGECAVCRSVPWEQVLSIEYLTTGMSPNLIVGLNNCALYMKNLNVQNVKQSAQMFYFTSDILNLRNGLILLLKIVRNYFPYNKIWNKSENCYVIN